MQGLHAAVLLLAAFVSSTHAAETVVRMTDIYPGGEGSYPSYLMASHKRLYFRATSSSDGSSSTSALWGFDGTNVSLIMSAYVQSLVDFNGALYFNANVPREGSRLHRFDGTNVSRVNVSPPTAFWGRPIVWDGALWWNAGYVEGNGISRFDGSTISALSSPPWHNAGPVAFKDALYYTAQDDFGVELWRYDGTSQQRLSDIHPGSDGSGPDWLFAHDHALYFAANDNIAGFELWRYTEAGVELVADINPGHADSYPNSFATFRGLLYFAADDGVHGTELFRYDGAVVSLVSNLNTNAVYEYDGEYFGHSNPSALTVYRDALYFIAFGGANRAIWRFDGTNAVALGGGMHGISDLVELNGQLYFDGDDLIWGRELWRVETNAEPRLSISRSGRSLSIELHEAETGSFVLEQSSDLQSWTPVMTNSTFAGRVAFTDELAIAATQRIYRAVRAAPP
jgi:ELWxxDGT repeat protein